MEDGAWRARGEARDLDAIIAVIDDGGAVRPREASPAASSTLLRYQPDRRARRGTSNFGSGSFLCTYPSFGEYFADDFAAKLGELPRYQSLIVMMEQCNSGGFNEPVIKFSTARATSVASAAIATQSSYASPDLHWDSFARDWFAAQTGHDPYGAALAFNPDTNGDGKIEATEAFNYANAVRNPQDSPQFRRELVGRREDLAGP